MIDVKNSSFQTESEYIKQIRINRIAMDSGLVDVVLLIDDKYYYEII